MGVKIHLHNRHRSFADGSETVEVNGGTVGECLNSLVKRYPGLHQELFDGKGKLKNTIEIYLNMESAYPDELLKPTREGDQIHVTVLLAGG